MDIGNGLEQVVGPPDRSFQEKLFRYGVYYPVVYSRGQRVPEYVRKFKQSQYLASEALANLQERKLARLLQHASRTVPYYRDKNRVSGFETARDWLMDFAPVTKREIISEELAFRSNVPSWFLTPRTTGGSTGEPMTVWKTREAMAHELAATWRAYSWAGVEMGDRQARFWGVPNGRFARMRARSIDFIANRCRLSAFSFDENDLADYLRRIKIFQPRYFYGYASLLDGFAQFVLSNNAQVPPLQAVISTSEILTAPMRARMEAAFQCRVFDEYGCGELGSVAHECQSGRLHFMAENMLVEVFDGDVPLGPGQKGELVITELNNLAMPLIRYRTGDMAVLSTEQCPCGIRLPLIENVAGRAYDTIKNSKGKSFHPEFFLYLVEDAKRLGLGIQAAQFIETSPLHLKVRIVAGSLAIEKIERFLQEKLIDGFDASVQVEVDQVERIEREASGKMRVVVSMKQPRPASMVFES
jgi:phenylacetate-CoA ligase